MADRVPDQQVRHIAHLARLELSDAEIATFGGQLGSILEYVQKLNELDVSDVEPTAHPLPIHNVFADDVPHTPMTTEAALANAPQREGSFFKVPKVLDTEGGA